MERTFRILLAEDDANDRRLLHLALERNGRKIDLREVTDGTEVIKYLEGRGKFGNRTKYPLPDLLIVDLKMPLVNGLEVLKWIRKEPRFARLPVVMLSGSGLAHDVAEAYHLGANSYLQKPNDFGGLVKKLAVLIDYWKEVELPAGIEIRE